MKKTALPQSLPSVIANMTPFELSRKISVAEAAAHNSMHVETFKRNFGHLIEKVGKRRVAVSVYNAIVLPPPEGA